VDVETDIPVEQLSPAEFGQLTIFPLLKGDPCGENLGNRSALTSKEAASSFRYLGSGNACSRIFMQGQANRI
jgi:hypothetical protein